MKKKRKHLLKTPKKSKSFIKKVDNLFKAGSISEVDRMIILYYLNESDFKSNSNKFN